MKMLVRRASATSNIIDVPISELAEYEDAQPESNNNNGLDTLTL